jgi:hypothetical protein
MYVRIFICAYTVGTCYQLSAVVAAALVHCARACLRRDEYEIL